MAAADDQRVLTIVRDFVLGSDHPDHKVYASSFMDLSGFSRDNGFRYLRAMKHVCKLTNLRGGKVLEIGCGLGWEAVTLHLLGHCAVLATDVLPSMIDAFQDSLDRMKRKGLNLDVSALQADVCDHDFGQESFDVIYSSEAIEHVRDLDLMMDNCYRALKPGGRILLLNDNNVFSRGSRAFSYELWNDRENSFEYSEKLKVLRPVEHAQAEPYKVMRQRMIMQANPHLSDSTLEALTTASAGMVRPEIESLARNYTPQTALPVPPVNRWCRNPETGEYAERLLDPFELAEMLRKRGFVASVRHNFRKFPYRYLNRIAFKPVNKLLFDVRSSFGIFGTKPV